MYYRTFSLLSDLKTDVMWWCLGVYVTVWARAAWAVCRPFSASLKKSQCCRKGNCSNRVWNEQFRRVFCMRSCSQVLGI